MGISLCSRSVSSFIKLDVRCTHLNRIANVKRILSRGAAILITATLTGCASVDFYEVLDNGKLKNTGFLYYPAKPYLLIETKDKNTVTSVISLPDTSNPHRVKQRKGWGTAELGFEIDNGMIKSFNSKSDSKGPETFASIAGLGTAQAALDSAKAAILAAELSAGDTKKATFADESVKDAPINYNVKVFMEAVAVIKNEVLPILKKAASNLSYEIETTSKVASILEQNTKINFEPDNPDALLQAVEVRRKLARTQVEILSNVSSTLAIYAENKAEKPEIILIAKNANEKLNFVMMSLSKFSVRSSSVDGLYEINYINGRVNLRKVTL